MNYDTFVDWIHRIYTTQENELDCDCIQTLLPAYAEARVSGRYLDSHYQRLQAHLVQCPQCQEVYQVLYHVLELEVTDGLPTVGELMAALETQPAVPEPLTFAL